jgi:Mce-associated membrane protein
MAVDVDARDELGVIAVEPDAEPVVDEETADESGALDDTADEADPLVPSRRRPSNTTFAVVAGATIIVALSVLVGWQGYRDYQTRAHVALRNLYVQTARQAAVNLTTIDWHEADADIKRITDGATGTFYDDFSKRSKPFVDVVKQAQSQSTGTVTEAGMESDNGDQGSVLVAITVKTTTAASKDDAPRAWRMRLTVQRVGDAVKVSNVEFVP